MWAINWLFWYKGFCLFLQAFLASQGWHFDVFICHAGPDSAFIALLHAEMLKCGLKPFVGTKSLETGSNGQMTVAGAIVKSPFFLTVLSKGFQSSMDSESEIEAALSFPRLHKKIIPVFYQMSLDDCIEARKVLYHKLAAITGLHRGSKTDEQFAKSISQEMREMAVEQLQSSKMAFIFVEHVRSVSGALSLLYRQSDTVDIKGRSGTA